MSEQELFAVEESRPERGIVLFRVAEQQLRGTDGHFPEIGDWSGPVSFAFQVAEDGTYTMWLRALDVAVTRR